MNVLSWMNEFLLIIHICALKIGSKAHISYQTSPWKTINCPWISWKSPWIWRWNFCMNHGFSSKSNSISKWGSHCLHKFSLSNVTTWLCWEPQPVTLCLLPVLPVQVTGYGGDSASSYTADHVMGFVNSWWQNSLLHDAVKKFHSWSTW